VSKLLEYLTDHWGEPRKSGRHLVWRCPQPDCPDKSGHFFVTFIEEEFAIGRCNRCGWPTQGSGYDIARILAEQAGISRRALLGRIGIAGQFDPSEASRLISALARDIGAFDPYEGLPDTPPHEVAETIPEIPDEVPIVEPVQSKPDVFDQGHYGLFLDVLQPMDKEIGVRARDYLFSRDLTPDLIKKYGIRYCHKAWVQGPRYQVRPDRPGYTMGQRFHARVMFPIVFRGKVEFWQGRDILEDNPKSPKYKNPVPGVDVTLKATDLLCGFDVSQGCDTLVIVEGPTCWIKVLEAGPYGCIAMLGKGLGGVRPGLLRAIAPKRIVLFFDPDVEVRIRRELVEICRAVAPTFWTQTKSERKDPGAMQPDEINYTVGAAREFGFLDSIGYLTSTRSRYNGSSG
jgi:hypothetical protein